MRARFQDKVAIVTGAASGIGRATVLRFLQEGAQVVATDIDTGIEAAIHAEIDTGLDAPARDAAANGQLVTMVGDVTQRHDVDAVVQRAINDFGRVDVLVNSAGITARNVRAEADFAERWEAVMQVNVKGTLLMCHAVVEAMRQNGGGAIVNLASIMGSVGYPTALPFSDGFNPYPQSKGAISQMTRDMGVRLAAEGIRVNAVAPGFVYTAITANFTDIPDVHAATQALHPIGRMGEAHEIANVIAFLASDEASFVAGAVWAVDGGYTAQ